MRVAFEKFAHLLVQRRGLGHEIGRHGGVQHVKAAQGVRPLVLKRPAHAAQQILGMDHADDVLALAPIDGQAGMRALQHQVQHLIGGKAGVDHFDARAVQHHLFDGAFAQVQRAQQAVAFLFFDRAAGLRDGQGAGDFLLDGKDMACPVGSKAQQRQDAAHDQPDHRDDRGHDPGEDADRAGDAAGQLLGGKDGIGLGQHLGKDQHQRGHHQRRNRHAAGAQDAGEQRRGQAGRQDVDHVVAQQQRAEQPFAVAGHVKRPRGACIPLVGPGPQLGLARGGQRRFRAREERRKRQ